MKKFRIKESGRSMIEMLGVLAIVGVLSVAGITGYSKAMLKYKTNKTLDEASTVVANIRSAVVNTHVYSSINNTVAVKLGIFPEEMIKTCNRNAPVSNCVKNAFGGDFRIYPMTYIRNGVYIDTFSIWLEQIPADACPALMMADWDGLDYINVYQQRIGNGSTSTNGYNGSFHDSDLQNSALTAVANACTGSDFLQLIFVFK